MSRQANQPAPRRTANQPAPLVLPASVLDNPPIEVVVAIAHAAGFDALSLWPGAGYGTDHDRAVIDDAGLTVCDVDALVVWVGPDDPGGPYFEEAPADAVFAAAATLGARSVNTLFVSPRGTAVDPAAVADAVARAAARAATLGLELTVEVGSSGAIRSLTQADAAVAASGAPNAGVLLDLWHHHWSRTPGGSLDRVRVVQLCDAPPERPADYGHATRYRREVPGHGVADLATALRGVAPATPIVVEVFNEGLLAEHGAEGFARLLADAARAVIARAHATP